MSMYDERKAADAAAFLIHLAGGEMVAAKLDRVLYIAERDSLRDVGLPLTGDTLLSLPSGMTLSHLHAFITEFVEPQNTLAPLYRMLDVVKTGVVRNVNPQDVETSCRFLSEGELGLLEGVWSRHGEQTLSQLADFTTTKCAEWLGPYTAGPIGYREMFAKLGHSPLQVSRLVARLRDRELIDAAFA